MLLAKPMILPMVLNQIIREPDTEASWSAALTKSADSQKSKIPTYTANLEPGIAFENFAFYSNRQNLRYGTKLQIGGLFRCEASFFGFGPAWMLHE